MPLDKMPDPGQFIPTHKSVVLHRRGEPVACIVDGSDPSLYAPLENDPSLQAALTGFLNKDEEFGLLFGFQLKIKTDSAFLQFTVYPDEEFVDTVIFDERVYIISKRMEPIFTLKVATDQFVMAKSEFDKFKKMA
ncbi:MAG: hypothetical protein KC444_03635 [Nitrosopumilus sp.]|nr:hypothetical protein [Nitrosopumilus sp.]